MSEEKKKSKKKTAKNKGGRPTKKQQLAKAIKDANSKKLTKSLQAIRLKIVDRINESSEDASTNRVRADDVKNLHQLWKSGKEILNDILREEQADKQNGQELTKLLDAAESAVDDMGWNDD